MGFKEKFADFLNDESGYADHRSLLRLGSLAVGSTVAALMIQPQADAGFQCGNERCSNDQFCCSDASTGLKWCSDSSC